MAAEWLTTSKRLAISVQTMRKVAEGSVQASLVMICAEDELRCNGDTLLLEQSFRRCAPLLHSCLRGRLAKYANSQSVFTRMIASLNLTRFSIGGWATFLLDLVASTDPRLRYGIEQVIKPWMANRELFERSDLVVFTSQEPTTMLLASEFSTRPLGKPLPSVEDACRCTLSSAGPERKEWVVEHNARHGYKVSAIVLRAMCSRCGTTWLLDTAHLGGEIYTKYGRYCVKALYDTQQGSQNDTEARPSGSRSGRGAE